LAARDPHSREQARFRQGADDQMLLRKANEARPPVKYAGIEVGLISETRSHVSKVTFWWLRHRLMRPQQSHQRPEIQAAAGEMRVPALKELILRAKGGPGRLRRYQNMREAAKWF
jgi:hypothetical protein